MRASISSRDKYNREVSTLKTNDGFILRKIYGEFLLMPVKTNEGGDEIVSFNEVGADIWMLAENRLTEDEIVVEILKIYGIEKGSVEEASVRIFISTLCEKKLLYREEHDA